MTTKEIKEIIELIKESNLAELKIKKKDFEISLKTDKYQKVQGIQTTSIAVPAPMTAAPMPAAPAAAVPVTSTDPATAEEGSTAGLLEVKSPIVGTFYRSSSPDKDAFVKVGDSIDVGSVVCIVEAMKLFNEIESEVAGKIVKVMIEDSSPVEYDQVLFLVDPKG
jgi:acetyl-CoA carboxylase biotin carboxyl carrier protein